ncbi:MAG: hypothetical protein KDE19_06865 [Caldilineaceae bacterium]|nr:hypothetical protein [Caldilineaceae bacterium]
MDSFVTVAEAVKLTGKSRRTITRLANRLEQTGSDQVMREKTARGYIWRISWQSLQDAFGAPQPQAPSTMEPHPVSAPPPVHPEPEHALQVAQQGYAGMMTMHQEVKQVYDTLLMEKEQQIIALSQELARVRKGFWAWLFGN